MPLSADVVLSLVWIALATALFCIGIQLPCRSLQRLAISVLFAAAMGELLAGTSSLVLVQLPPVSVPFAIGLALHGVALLLARDGPVLLWSSGKKGKGQSLPATPLLAWLHAVVLLVWTNFRHLPDGRLGPASSSSTQLQKSTNRQRLAFGVRRGAHALVLWLANWGCQTLLMHGVLVLRLSARSFSPAKQGLWPLAQHLTRADWALRAMSSVHWIWTTYMGLVVAHDLCAVVSVSLFGCDVPEAWPSLYGSPREADSVRHFWSRFWHRLHVPLFNAFTPRSLHKHTNLDTEPGSVAATKKSDDQSATATHSLPDAAQPTVSHAIHMALRAFWIFLLSAAGHALANWVLFRANTVVHEVRFFVLNWVACLVETLAARVVEGSWLQARLTKAHAAWLWSLLGNVYVWLFFVCVVPGWQYPIVYDTVMAQQRV